MSEHHHPWICVTCAAEFAPSAEPPKSCPICEDPRQYVGAKGQLWTHETELAKTHKTVLRQEESGLLGIGVEPGVAISQRALLITHPDGGVWFEGVPLLDDDAVAEIQRRGGVRAMVASHPHLYGTMVTNSIKLGNVPIYLPEADRQWLMYPHENVRFFEGDFLDLGHGVTLHVTGGHFDGSAVAHWPEGAEGKGALLTGDTILISQDPDWVSFMWSTPNRVNLGPKAIKRIVEMTERLSYDRIHDSWWGSRVDHDAKAKVLASAQRILDIQQNG